MLAIGTELLLGRAVMTRWDAREEAEWPPHPDRVFMALVAAWGDSGEDSGGKAALQWLERLGPPALKASEVASIRNSFISYVPVNDSSSPINKGKAATPMGSIAFGRSRQPRSYPTVIPREPQFHLVWPHATLPEGHRAALEAVCAQIAYLGHSATPVRAWVDSTTVEPNLVPTSGKADYRLRVFGPGRVEYLKNRFDAGLRPQPSQWVGYSRVASDTTAPAGAGPFDPGLLVLRAIGGRRFGLESSGVIADTVRRTLMSRNSDNPPTWLSGHNLDGSPARIRRPAYLPLAFVNHEHADGHLLGIGIAVPSDFAPESMELLLKLLLEHGESSQVVGEDAHTLRLRVKHAGGSEIGEFELELDERSFRQRAVALRPETWTGPSDVWATVTPIVLPRFPRRELTAESIVAQACVDAGYPAPACVRVQYAPFFPGVPHARSFPTLHKKGLPPRLRMHAAIQFEESVRGPVCLGAGRYLGHGVCRPILEQEAHQ